MRALRILLRDRVTSWVRDPSRSVGTAIGRLVLALLLLGLLYLLGKGSRHLGMLIREVNPDGNVLRIINSGMLYLVPVLTTARFVLQSPPSLGMTAYLDLPIARTKLLRGQILLFLLSVHTGAAVVLVVPVWAAEVWTTLPMVDASAWLATALLVAAVLPSLGTQLLNVLLGRYPKWFVVVLAGGVGLAGIDALLAPNLFRGLSRGLFGMPVVGLFGALAVTAGLYWGVLRAMRARLEIDRRTTLRKTRGATSDAGFYPWIEQTLPAGRLVALEVRQIVRTRRQRGLALLGLSITMAVYGVAAFSLWETGRIGIVHLAFLSVFGIGGPACGLGVWTFGIWAGHAEGLLARPQSLGDLMKGKLLVLWGGLLPGTVALVGMGPWLPPRQTAFLLAMTLFWWGIVIPSFVYLGPLVRTPVDPSASAFALGMNMRAQVVPVLLLLLVLVVGPVVAAATGAWWEMSIVVGGLGGMSLIGLAWTLRPFVRQLDRHRHAMLAGFRENEPI
jgi:hypothetical protein